MINYLTFVNEAKKKENLELVSIDNRADLYSPYEIMNGFIDNRRKRRIVDYIFRNTKNKKVQFTNEKDGKNIKKERIIMAAFWVGDDLYFQGTKKAYKVNKYGKVGYYRVAPMRVFSELDPYGEEDWD